MEESQNTTENSQQETPQQAPVVPEPAEKVNFSSIPVRSSKPKLNAKIFLGIFILIIFVVGGFLIFKDGGDSEAIEETVSVPEIETPTSTPVSTPVPVDKSKVAIEIQNGTGISGEAAFLRDALKALGYSDFKLGNASTSDNVTTIVTYNKDLVQSVQDEITQELNSLYKEVSVKTSATQASDVVVITGLQKNATAKPAATPTVKPSASPSASSSPSPTASPTPTL